MKLEVFDINGNALGRFVDLPSDVFGLELTKNHEHIVYLAVKQYLAHQRQGTHKTKERNEIAGSTRKLHKQKGTGGSRKGSIKNPLYRGGGRIFGPRPRNYELKLNKKVSRLARKAVLSSKVSEHKIIIIQDFNFDAPKTKNYLSILNSFNLGGKSLVDLKSLHLNYLNIHMDLEAEKNLYKL
jgi:large subunit ribosomal protein L4